MCFELTDGKSGAAAGPLDGTIGISSTAASTRGHNRGYDVVMDRRGGSSSSLSTWDNTERDPLEFFDQEGYLAGDRTHRGQDNYAKTKFNQLASDNLPMDRSIPDTRTPM
jgi:hypothetical protein